MVQAGWLFALIRRLRPALTDGLDDTPWLDTTYLSPRMRLGRGNKGSVFDANPVMDFITLPQTSQNGNGALNARLFTTHWLKASFECCIFFNVLPVFIKCCCANGMQFTASKLRLQEIGCIHCPLAGTSPNNGVQLINK